MTSNSETRLASAGESGASRPAVVGLDLSITATGIAYRDGHLATVGGPAADGDRRLPTIKRQVRVALGISDDGTRWFPPDLVVIEDLPTHAHGSGVTAMVHGVVRELLVDRIPYVLVPPATLKKYATGRGNATKADMRVALLTRTGVDVRDDNQVDAAWLRHLGLDLRGCAEITMPKVNRDALAKLNKPEGVA